MNEQIKLLAQLADLPLIHGSFLTAAQEKFAQLIIKECVEIAKVSERHGALGWYEITKHFGVKE